MSEIAIDIALLPPEHVMDAAIAINKRLLAEQPTMLALSKTERLPHVTLLQGVMDTGDLELAKSNVSRIARAQKPLHLTGRLTPHHGQTFFNITISSGLRKLHRTVMDEFEPLVSYRPEVSQYADDEVSEQTLDYVQNFRKEAAFDHFSAHITLGMGELRNKHERIAFAPRRLAICHLGNFGTCKKVLYEVSLT